MSINVSIGPYNITGMQNVTLISNLSVGMHVAMGCRAMYPPAVGLGRLGALSRGMLHPGMARMGAMGRMGMGMDPRIARRLRRGWPRS